MKGFSTISFFAVLFLIGGWFVGCDVFDSTNIYKLSTSVSPSGGGTVTPPNGEFEEGSKIEIKAEPSEEYLFARWEGDITGTNNPYSFEINSDTDITAIFERREYPLKIEVEGEGLVNEEIVEQPTKQDYKHGTIVQLTAEPAEGWKFDHWEDDLKGSENPTTIEIVEEVQVTAVFNRREYQLTVNTEGEGEIQTTLISGTETENGYLFESQVEITANPVESWRFKEWRGDLVSDKNPITITIDHRISR